MKCINYMNVGHLFVLLVAITNTGCSRPATPASAPSQNITIGGVIVGYDVLVELPSGGFVGITDGSNVQQEGKSFELKGGTFQVNGESFGEIAKGDKVKIEQSGHVYVNGKPREPVIKTQ